MAKAPRRAVLGAWLVALLAGALLLLLLGRLTHVGVPFSFDPMLYARSLWGLAHGEPVNPIVGVHALSVHAHLHLYVLAPLTNVLRAVDVLMVSQAIAFVAVIGLAGAAVARDVPRRFATIAAVTTGALLAFASPWVCNPALFDVRPDHVAAAFAVAGLLRLRQTRRVDVMAALLLTGAALCREEVALALAPAVVLAPGTRGDLRARLVTAAGLAAWWVAYWFALRGWFGGELATARLAGHEQVLLGEGSWWSTAWSQRGAKIELVATLLLTGGGLALLAPRWWVAALPAAGFALVQNRLGDQMIQLHYTMFAAPILVVATVEGATRAWHVAGSVPARRAVLTASLVVGAIIASCSTSWPWGHRFDAVAFALDDDVATHEGHALTRALLDDLPTDASLVVPYAWGAALADRADIHREPTFAAAVSAGDTVPTDVDFIVVSAARFGTYGRAWAQRYRLPLVARAPLAAVFATDGRPLSDPVLASIAAPPCAEPIADLEGVGWRVCDPARVDGRVEVTVERLAVVPGPGPLWMTDAGPADIGGGLIAMSRVVPGHPIRAVMPDGAGRLWLMTADGAVARASGPAADDAGRIRLPGAADAPR